MSEQGKAPLIAVPGKVTEVISDRQPQKIAIGIAIVAILFWIAAISVFATGNKSNSGVGLMITSIVLFGMAPVALFAGLHKQENEKKQE